MPMPIPVPPPLVREIVASGGPNAQDHPDLFRLVEKQQQRQQQQQQQQQHEVGAIPEEYGCSGVRDKAAAGGNYSTALASAGETPSEHGRANMTFEQLPRGTGVASGGKSGAGGIEVFAKEEEPASSSPRQERTEQTVEEVEEDPAEPAVPLEKCPW